MVFHSPYPLQKGSLHYWAPEGRGVPRWQVSIVGNASETLGLDTTIHGVFQSEGGIGQEN